MYRSCRIFVTANLPVTAAQVFSPTDTLVTFPGRRLKHNSLGWLTNFTDFPCPSWPYTDEQLFSYDSSVIVHSSKKPYNKCAALWHWCSIWPQQIYIVVLCETNCFFSQKLKQYTTVIMFEETKWAVTAQSN